ncbi:MAG: DNA alkylation repair protein [Actinomycetota bacterium]|nr:DNA alkylation repair protein [Actinomycetota bacterium]
MVDVRPPTATLDRLLSQAADEATRDHWERYMKGAAMFRGVPMPGIRAAVKRVWTDEGLAAWATEDLLTLAHQWFGARPSEDKLAAVLLLAEHVAPRLALVHVPALARPLAVGHVADWNVCDWYATKALHAFLAGADDLLDRAVAVAAWSGAAGLWQRRAGVVAFAKLAPRAADLFDGFVPLVLDACARNLVSDDRFAHTGPGWFLRELSRSVPDAVAAFVEAHPELSPEARRMATARLRPGPYRRR